MLHPRGEALRADDFQACPFFVRAYDNIGPTIDPFSFQNFEQTFRKALAIDEEAYGPNHPEIAADLGNLAVCLARLKKNDEAEATIRRALPIDEVTYGSGHPFVAIRLRILAGILSEAGRLSESELLHRQALSIDVATYGAEHPVIVTDLEELADLLNSAGRSEEAATLYQHARMMRESVGETQP